MKAKLNPRELFVRTERCGTAIFSKSGRIDFRAKQSISSFREREINPFVIDQIVEVPTDKWQRESSKVFSFVSSWRIES